MAKLRRMVSGGILALAVITAVFTLPHRVWSYSGPGTLRDHGVLSYPRYRLELPDITLGAGPRSYTLGGVPTEQMNLMLYVPGASVDDVGPLERPQLAHTKITARLFEEATTLAPRRLLCSAAGSPDTAARDSDWVVSGSRLSAALYHCDCLHMSFSRQRRYLLVLEIAAVDPSGLLKVLRPVLEGGGIEFP